RRDRGSGGSRRVGDREIGGTDVLETGGRGGRAGQGGLHELAGLVLEGGRLQLALHHVRVFDVAYGPVGRLHALAHARVALGPDPGRPLHGLAGAHRALPIRADLRQVVGEGVGGAGAV